MIFIRRGHYSPFLLGLLIGGAIALCSILLFDRIYQSSLREKWDTWAILGGTLLAGIFAGWAAFESARAQIKQVEEAELDRRNASLRASKAMLPTVLAELGRRCEHNAMVVLFNSKNALDTEPSLPDHLSKYPGAEPTNFLEDHEFQVYKDCIEFADIQSARVLTHIVRRYQVLYSRSYDIDFPEVEKDRLGRVSTPRSLHLAFDWNALNMLLEHCLPYARDEDDEISLLFKGDSLFNVFSGLIQSEITSPPPILSDYRIEAKAMATKMVEDLADSDGNLDLSYLLNETLL